MRRIYVQRASAAPLQPAADESISNNSLSPSTYDPVPPGTLYLISMPIGNPEDITLRSLRALREVSSIMVESLSVSRKLMRYWNITTPLLPYGGRAGKCNQAEALAQLQAGYDIAYICDAGTPGIADPCAALVSAAVKRNVPVAGLPGPAAALAALTASGLPITRFVFDGFPPHSAAQRSLFFQKLAGEERAIVLYETPSRLRSTLNALQQTLGSDRQAALAWNLTRPTEAWLRGSLAEIRAQVANRTRRGEITLVIASSATD